MSSPQPRWKVSDALGPGIAAVKGQWRAFVLIQVAAAALVVAYYRSPAIQSLAEDIARMKVAGGLAFAFVAGAIAGGLMPELAKLATGTLGRLDGRWTSRTLHTAAVFGFVGVMVDVFYQCQGAWFGVGIAPLTLTIKTLVDMALFAPLIAIPFEVAALDWGHRGYKVSVLLSHLGPAAYRDRVVPALLPCWAFWLPVLYCVYALPPNLQFPFSILAEAAWSIIVVYVAGRAVASREPSA